MHSAVKAIRTGSRQVLMSGLTLSIQALSQFVVNSLEGMDYIYLNRGRA